MSRIRSLLFAGVVALAAPSVVLGQSADATAKLERARQKKPNDPAIARSLGIAYYKQEKWAEARTNLEAAVRLDPRDGAAALYLGLTAEQQKDIPGAKAAYQTYARYGKTAKV